MYNNFMKRILIFKSNIGNGHQSISNAIEQIISNNITDTQVKQLNIMPVIGSPLQRILSNYFSEYLQKKYQESDNEKSAKTTHRLTTPLLFPKISTAILKFKPHLIIATNAFSTEEVGTTLKILDLNIPHLVILADPFSIHHGWTTYKDANKYLVHDQYAQKIFVSRHIHSQKIAITGLPLRQEILQPHPSQSQSQFDLSLDSNKFTLFIGGSGEGVGNIYPLTSKLLKNKTVLALCQLIVVAGKNKALKSRLLRLQKKHPQILSVYGFTQKMPQLINASHLIIGKPGPNLLMETIALGKPFLTTGQPMGQELGNYQYIHQKNIGLVTHHPTQTLDALLQLIHHPEKLTTFKANLTPLQKKLRQAPRKVFTQIKALL